MTSRQHVGPRPRSRQNPRPAMATNPSAPLVLSPDIDLSVLERQLLENTTLNYSRDEAAALCATLYADCCIERGED